MLQPSYRNGQLLRVNIEDTHFTDGPKYFNGENDSEILWVSVSVLCTVYVADKSYY